MLPVTNLKQSPNVHVLVRITGIALFSLIEFSFICQIIFPSAGILAKQSMEDAVAANNRGKTASQFKWLHSIKLGEFGLFREAAANCIHEHVPTSVCLDSGGELTTKSSKMLVSFLQRCSFLFKAFHDLLWLTVLSLREEPPEDSQLFHLFSCWKFMPVTT